MHDETATTLQAIHSSLWSMPNQPVRYSRRGGSPVAATVAGLLFIVIAVGVLAGTVALFGGGTGLFGGNATATAPQLAAGSGQPSPATSGGAPVSSHQPVDGSPAPGSVEPGSSPEASPAPASSESPAPTPSQPGIGTLDPPPAPGPFSIDLYRRNAYVEELKPINCVPAAMQTMINIMTTGRVDRTQAKQQKLYRLARSLSGPKLVGDGAEPEGWAAGLTQLGFGTYVVDVEPTRRKAVEQAAIALRMTGRPVGLLAWRGAHSWVVSGFQATADPAFTSDFAVTGLYIEDVWYPRVSSIWGPSFAPDTLDPVEDLHIDFLPWRRPTHRYPDKDGQYVLVLPVSG